MSREAAPGAGAGTPTEVTVTFLEMRSPPEGGAPAEAAREDVAVEHVVRPGVAFYRFLYEAVGRRWSWYERTRLSDAELAAILADPLVEVHVLYVAGRVAGYAELDRREPRRVELAYFGLVPGHIGQGLGRWFLGEALRRAWRTEPALVTVNTCTLDHPRAIPTYEAAGFEAAGTLTKHVVLPSGYAPGERERPA